MVLAALRPGLSLTDLEGSVKGPSLTLGVLKEPPKLSRTPVSLTSSKTCRPSSAGKSLQA